MVDICVRANIRAHKDTWSVGSWIEFDAGCTVGLVGSEGGTILLDHEHTDGARITLERNARSAPFAITCGVYGWMIHTRFFASDVEARREYDTMKIALSELAQQLSQQDADDAPTFGAKECSNFVDRFP